MYDLLIAAGFVGTIIVIGFLLKIQDKKIDKKVFR